MSKRKSNHSPYLFVKEAGNLWYTAQMVDAPLLVGTKRGVGGYLLPVDSLPSGEVLGVIERDADCLEYQSLKDCGRSLVNGVAVRPGQKIRLTVGSSIRFMVGMPNEVCVVVIPSDLDNRCSNGLPLPRELEYARDVKIDGRDAADRESVLSAVGKGECLYVDGDLYFAHGGRWYAYKRKEPFATMRKPSEIPRQENRSFSVAKQNTCIVVSDVVMCFDATSVFEKLNIVLTPHELVALCGKSGQGKSTFMRLLTGIDKPQGGTVSFKGSVGYVPQDDPMHSELTVQDHLMYYAALKGIPKGQRKQTVEEILDSLGILEKRDCRIGGGLSGGELKRVSLALELLSNPDILCLDEPTSGLDIGMERRLLAFLKTKAHAGSGGPTILVVTHGFSNIEIYDKVVFFGGGDVCYYGEPKRAHEYFGVSVDADIYDVIDKNAAAFVRKWKTEGRKW